MADFFDSFYSGLTEKTFIKTLPEKRESEKELTTAQKIGSQFLGTPDPAKFEVDALLSINDTKEYITSDYPVEDGTSRSDGTIKKPRMVEIEFILTDTPIGPILPFISLLQASNGRASDLVEKLEEEADKSAYVLLSTTKRIYPRMQIAKIATSRDERTGHAFIVSMTLKELFIVKSDDVDGKNAKVDDSVKHTVGKGNALGFITNVALSL